MKYRRKAIIAFWLTDRTPCIYTRGENSPYLILKLCMFHMDAQTISRDICPDEIQHRVILSYMRRGIVYPAPSHLLFPMVLAFYLYIRDIICQVVIRVSL